MLILYLVPAILICLYVLFGLIGYPIWVTRHCVKSEIIDRWSKCFFLVTIWGAILTVPIASLKIRGFFLAVALMSFYSIFLSKKKLLRWIGIFYIATVAFMPSMAIQLSNAMKNQILVNFYETQKKPLTIHDKAILFGAYIETKNPMNLSKALSLGKEFDDVKALDRKERLYLAYYFGKITRADDNLKAELMVYEHFLPNDTEKPIRGLLEASAYFEHNDKIKAREVLVSIKPLIQDNKKFQLIVDTMIEAIDNQRTTLEEFNRLLRKNLELSKANQS